MTQLTSMLHRELVKFERPKTIFNKLTYLEEQSLVYGAVKDVQVSAVLLYPEFAGHMLVSHISEKRRADEAKKRLITAKSKLARFLP